MKELLGKDSILKRRRRNIIGMRITAISWLVEFLSGLILLLRFRDYQTIEEHERMGKIFHNFGLALTTILVPGSYLLNDEAYKLLILAKGWRAFFQNNVVNSFQRNETSNENNQIVRNNSRRL